jgi:putative SOS response-associated peptidase YedK
MVPQGHREGMEGDYLQCPCRDRQDVPGISRQLFRRRCLVAADGWYEWMGRDDDRKKKQPWLFEPQDGAPIMLAGIWGRCETTDQGLVESFTIVTQPAGGTIEWLS